MKQYQQGIWSGILATGPMTLAMFRMHRSLPASEKSPLPPATLTKQTASAVGLRKGLSENAEAELSLINHFAYGAACGVVYSLLPKAVRNKPLLSGSLFGVGVWAASYLVWIPAVGFRASAYKMPLRRNTLMIAAHLVWGACLGYAQNELSRSGNEMLSGRRKASSAE